MEQARDSRVPADYAGCPVTVTEALAKGRSLIAPRWGLPDAAVGLVLGFTAGLVAGLALALGTGTETGTGTEATTPAPMLLLAMIAPWLGLAGWPLIATSWRGNGPRIDLGLRLTWSDAAWGALGGVIALVLAALASLVTSMFVDGVTSNAAEAAGEMVDDGRIWTVLFALAIVLGAPVVEEIFFRGLLFAGLRKRGVSTALTVILTAVIFAAFHFEPVRMLILLPTGLVLGWVRARTGSTGASIVAHGVVNAPGALVLLVMPAGMTP